MTERGDDGLRQALLAEYDNVTKQIVHWDTFFWTKGMFFLGVEGAAITITLKQMLGVLDQSGDLGLIQFLILCAFVLTNGFLCMTWFLTNVRNRLYSASRFERGFEIENHPVFTTGDAKLESDPLRIYHHQKAVLARERPINISSHRFEIVIPLVFLVGWVGILALGFWLFCADAKGKVIALVVLVVILFSIFMFFKKMAPWLLP